MMPQEVRLLLARLESAGHQAWAVGGCVRDTLRGAAPSDWDVTTDARPEQVMALFGETAIPTGLKHGTVTVCAGELRVEVTTFRRDGTYSDHRRPDEVQFSTSLEEDLARRDLTVNAMAMDLRGHICDPFGGQEDLSRRVLRCVGEPMRRLDEDALRIMRTLRFAAVLGFAIEPETAAALHRRSPLLADIAVERILVEMDKLLAGQDMASVLLAFPDVIGVFLPEIRPCVGFDQRNKHHCYDVWEHSVRAAEAIAPDAVLRWAMLLHDIGKPDCFTEDEQGVGHFYGPPDGKGRRPGGAAAGRGDTAAAAGGEAGGQPGAESAVPRPGGGDRQGGGHTGRAGDPAVVLHPPRSGGAGQRPDGPGPAWPGGGPDAAEAAGRGDGRRSSQRKGILAAAGDIRPEA